MKLSVDYDRRGRLADTIVCEKLKAEWLAIFRCEYASQLQDV